MTSAQPKHAQQKSERLEARLSSVQKALIQRAADLQGRSLTDFVISCSQTIAAQVIREHEVVTLTAQESENFVQSLLGDAKPSAELKKAAKRYQKFLAQNKKP